MTTPNPDGAGDLEPKGPDREPPPLPDPRGKKWVLLQLLGGFVVVAGVLVTTYLVAQLAQARQPLRVPPEAALILVGLAAHVAGRIGLARLGR